MSNNKPITGDQIVEAIKAAILRLNEPLYQDQIEVKLLHEQTRKLRVIITEELAEERARNAAQIIIGLGQ